MKVITNKVRFNYPHLLKPNTVNEHDEPRYTLTILIPKSDNIVVNNINEAILSAKGKGIEKFNDLENIKIPLQDGDTVKADDENYRNHYFINTTSKYKPGIVDKDLNRITNEDEIYPGCYGRVSINFYPYCKDNVNGIGCALLNVQKVSEGDRIGTSSVLDDFSIINEDFTMNNFSVVGETF